MFPLILRYYRQYPVKAVLIIGVVLVFLIGHEVTMASESYSPLEITKSQLTRTDGHSFLTIVVRNNADFDMKGFVLELTPGRDKFGGTELNTLYVISSSSRDEMNEARVRRFAPLIESPIASGVPRRSFITIHVPVSCCTEQTQPLWKVEIVDLLY